MRPGARTQQQRRRHHAPQREVGPLLIQAQPSDLFSFVIKSFLSHFHSFPLASNSRLRRNGGGRRLGARQEKYHCKFQRAFPQRWREMYSPGRQSGTAGGHVWTIPYGYIPSIPTRSMSAGRFGCQWVRGWVGRRVGRWVGSAPGSLKAPGPAEAQYPTCPRTAPWRTRDGGRRRREAQQVACTVGCVARRRAPSRSEGTTGGRSFPPPPPKKPRKGPGLRCISGGSEGRL